MRLPVIEGLIRRRLLVNFRADPDVVARLLPAGFRPKQHKGFAIVGICLIRLEEVRPKGLPRAMGISSENAAHRIAVEWEAPDAGATGWREGVYIPRRDTGSVLNALAGGRVFPGEHHFSRFAVEEIGGADGSGPTIRFSMQSVSDACCETAPHADNDDSAVAIHLEGRNADALPPGSVFHDLSEASAYFEGGCTGYSATCDAARLDGIELRTARWEVRPLDVTRVYSSYFANATRFPAGTVEFDHALIMRGIPHEWHSVPDFAVAAPARA
ncbi:hypothetical protein DB346_15215 [Verrucomicrobia bacterium LW23]|nr:hypothetical protein DB346_15215 [Verrucomicrobia bacterium LW23]